MDIEPDEYQPRTAERLIEILRAQSQNPRSWQQEAADEIERLRELVTDIREVVINHKDEIEHFDDDDLKALDSAGAVVFPRKD